MISLNLNASNQEDWTIQFLAVDAETGDAIDFTGATIAFRIKDKDGCIQIDASTTAGTITLPIVGTVQISIAVALMKTLCAGTYNIGCVYSLNSTTAQLFHGTVDIYDGIATI